MNIADLEKMVQARIEYLTKHPEQASGTELLDLIKCARNFVSLPNA